MSPGVFITIVVSPAARVSQYAEGGFVGEDELPSPVCSSTQI